MSASKRPPTTQPVSVLHRDGSVVRFWPVGDDRMSVDLGNATFSLSLTVDEARALFLWLVRKGFMSK